MKTKRWWIIAALWILAFAVALLLDGPISRWVGRSPLFDPRYNSAWKLPKRIGEFQYHIPLIVAVGIFHRRKWRASVMLLWAAGFAGAIYSILKWVVGRTRPNLGHGPWEFSLFNGGMRGLISSGNLAFPSGHTTFAFAIAGAMAVLIPKWRWAFYVLASLCAAQRVLEYAHHPSDVVASAALGILCAQLGNAACEKFLPQPAPSGVASS